MKCSQGHRCHTKCASTSGQLRSAWDPCGAVQHCPNSEIKLGPFPLPHFLPPHSRSTRHAYMAQEAPQAQTEATILMQLGTTAKHSTCSRPLDKKHREQCGSIASEWLQTDSEDIELRSVKNVLLFFLAAIASSSLCRVFSIAFYSKQHRSSFCTAAWSA